LQRILLSACRFLLGVPWSRCHKFFVAFASEAPVALPLPCPAPQGDEQPKQLAQLWLRRQDTVGIG